MASFPTSSTPFPNHLLDHVLPTLRDTEWRLLCVIVRQTLGWQGDYPHQRKESDWLTHGQLKARTGRSSEAVSHALDALVRRNLIQVWSDRGELLATPADRRRASGRLTFRLCPQALGRQENEEAAKGRKTETGISESEDRVSETGIRKAKTTKETHDKKAPDGVRRTGLPSRDEPSGDSERKKAVTGTPNPDVRRFLEEYRQMFVRHSAQGEPPPISWGRDGKLVKGLLNQYGYERLRELLGRFFQSEDAWVKKRGYALSCFLTVLPQLLMDGGKRPDPKKPVVMQMSADTPWNRAGSIPVSDASLFERYPELARRVRGQPP